MTNLSAAISSKLTQTVKKNSGHMPVPLAFLFIVLGVFLGCVVLEIFLWIAGKYYISTKDTARVSQEDAKRIRIVALGESTTAPLSGPAWPEFLEQELNKRAGRDAYRVYNLGVSGSNSSAIYRRLTTEVMSLRPDMVITMMGVNDIKYLALPASVPTWRSYIQDRIRTTRLYKLVAILARLMSGHTMRALTQQALSCKADEMGDSVWLQKSLPAYEAIIKNIYPDRYVGQFSNNFDDQAAEKVLKEFLRKYPLSYQAYEVLVDHYASRSMWPEVVTWTRNYKDAKALMHTCVMVNPKIHTQSKDVVTRHIEDIGIFMDSLSVIAQRMLVEKSRGDWAYYEAIKAKIGTQGKPSNFNTAEIYRNIYKYLQQRDVTYIAMQYPLLSVRTIQDMFPFDSEVVFVSNELNFQNALKTISYDDMFVDSFAGVFGHTTAFGSQMIASRAADVIWEVNQPKH